MMQFQGNFNFFSNFHGKDVDFEKRKASARGEDNR